MKNSFKLPVMVRLDNVGAIFMASNITTTSCIKHMDIRWKYVNQYVNDGVDKIIFVNDNNIFIKNLSAELHEKHSKKMVGERLKKFLVLPGQ